MRDFNFFLGEETDSGLSFPNQDIELVRGVRFHVPKNVKVVGNPAWLKDNDPRGKDVITHNYSVPLVSIKGEYHYWISSWSIVT